MQEPPDWGVTRKMTAFNSIHYRTECPKLQEWGHTEGVEIYNRARCSYSVPATEVVTFIDYYPHEEMTYWHSSPLVLKSQSITNASPTTANVH